MGGKRRLSGGGALLVHGFVLSHNHSPPFLSSVTENSSLYVRDLGLTGHYDGAVPKLRSVETCTHVAMGLVDVIIAQNVQLSCLKYEPLTARQSRT